MPSLPQVVRPGMHHNRAAEDALGTDQFDLGIGDGALGVARGVGLEVAQVANVAVGVFGGAVLFGEWIDWIEGGR